MSDALEERYRRALRWYPNEWRRRNEDVVVGTLLDVAAGDHRSAPARGELAGLAANGILARFACFTLIVPTGVRDRAAALSLGAGTAISVAGALFSVQSAYSVHQSTPIAYLPVVTFGPFASLAIILYGLWVIAVIAAACGLARTCRALLVLTIPAAIIARILSERLHMDVFPTSTTVIFLEMFAVIAIVGRPALSRGLRISTVAAMMTGLLAITVRMLWIYRQPSVARDFPFERSFFTIASWAGWFFAALLLAATLSLAFKRRAWSGALFVTSVPVLALGLFGSKDLSYIVQFLVPWVILIVIAITILLVLHRTGLRVRITRN